MVESDGLEVVCIVNSTSVALQESALVLSIKRWLFRDWQVEVCHVSRACNRVANMMAARGRGSLLTATVFSVPPEEVCGLVEEEMQRAV
ncbi:hypothetical protein V6N13_042266 [Hibiscus sabdariffa]|uniref:RNase H type-1 domain-containing protein n=1 Tax=Hibiscus sabdariffa TaxID=183260 RepID=A0ABR2DEH8_9ROSI